MSLPHLLRIGSHLISVEAKELDGDTFGEFDEFTNTIFINSRLPRSQQEATLIHEIIGVCNPTLHDSELGHMLMESLSQQLYQVLRDNKLNFSE